MGVLQSASFRTACFVSKDAAFQRGLTPAALHCPLQELPVDLDPQVEVSQENAAAQQVRVINQVASNLGHLRGFTD